MTALSLHKQFKATLFLLVTALLATVAGKNKTVLILSLLPYPHPTMNPSWAEGPSIAVALELAKDHINNQTETLPDYSIELLHDDSGCEFTTRAYVGFVRNVYASGDKRVVGIVGPGCSSGSLAVSPIASNENVALITVHGGGSPLLADRTKHRYALGTLGNSAAFAQLAIKLMVKSKWTRIGILFDPARLFHSTTARKFDTLIQSANNITNQTLEVGFLSAVYDTFLPLDVILGEGIRINFIFTPVGTTQKILCLAHHRGMVYPAYQWIVTSNTFDEVAKNVSFTYKGSNYFCSEATMKTSALNRTCFLNYELMALNQTAPSTHSLLTSAEYDQLYRDTIDEYNIQGSSLNCSNISYTVWSTYFYDTLWAWAVALDNLTRNNPDLDLTEYGHGDQNMTDMILDEFYSLDFYGVSGRIRFFNDTGFLNRAVSVNQVLNGSKQKVALLNDDSEFAKIGPLEYIPDRFPDQVFSNSEVLVAIFVIIPILQLIVLFVLHVLTIKYRGYHTVKASSPKLNQLVFIGCYVFGFTSAFYSIRDLSLFDEFTAEFLCNLTWAWLLPFSFTLTFGTVAAKTWRIYRIFKHYLNPGRFIGDYYLMGFVFILLAVDVVLGIFWMAVDPLRITETYTTVTEGVVTFRLLIYGCFSNNFLLTFGPVMGVRVILILVVFVLAFLTRGIQNPSFTTKTLRVLVYLFGGVMLGGFMIYYLFLFFTPASPGSFVALEVMFQLMLFLYITLVCFPPLLPLLKEKYSARFPKEDRKLSTAEPLFDTVIGNEGLSKFYI